MQYIHGQAPARSDSVQSNVSDSNWETVCSGLRVYKPSPGDIVKPRFDISSTQCSREGDNNLSFASTTSSYSSAASYTSDADSVSVAADVETENQASACNDAAIDSMPQFTVYVWYGHNAGLVVETCPHTKFPMVKRAEGDMKLPGMWNVRYGDYLLSFNGESTHASEMDIDDVRQLLDTSGVRPAILRFRHASPEEIKTRPRGAQPTKLSSNQLEFQRQRMAHEQSISYVIINEGCDNVGVGLHTSNEHAKYPSVVYIDADGAAAEQSKDNLIEVGDLLLSVNENDVASIGTTMAMNVIRASPRPLVLAFFRKNAGRKERSSSIEL